MVEHNDFLADPTGHLVAVIDEPADAKTAQTELTNAGFNEVHVYEGQDGAESLDAHGNEHGASGGLIRGLQQAFSNKDNLAEYEDAVRTGDTVIAVKVHDNDERDRAEDILERHRAHTINHFGTTVVRTLKV